MNKLNGKIVGYDPGGNGNHGFAILEIEKGKPSNLHVKTLETANDVIAEIKRLEGFIGIGIDTLTCWCTGASGSRPADRFFRGNDEYKDVQNSVISPNSLFGSMALNGMSVLISLRNKDKDIPISETHPKVLYYALKDEKYNYEQKKEDMDKDLIDEIGVPEIIISNDHEWDAAISAYSFYKGYTKEWSFDLHQKEPSENEGVMIEPCGKTFYYWPDLPKDPK